MTETAASPTFAEPMRTVADLRGPIAAWRRDGLRVGLVPTMGALHDGHLTLIRDLAGQCDRVVVSVFVNPTQFNDPADLAAYPRREADDVAAALGAGADLVYAPTAEAMYPAGFATTVSVRGLTDRLEGAHRPGHFDGVATVVTKLLTQASPDVAAFGEKDYQQLLVIRRLAADLDLGVEIQGVATVREADGLALSSRNQHLSAAARATAAQLYRALAEGAERAAAGEAALVVATDVEAALLDAGFDGVDYVTLADAETLDPMVRLGDRPARLLAAARLNGVRLIDNLAVIRAGA
ncbi:pantoate--beta-alanine ligase [Rhodothalassium salexigens]|uniref:pantoate--beta-alanine ligase n=1 Tax=Rhodothalassium salexigens TaxID=1086 RepID=UPI0019116688|nr:pantoate--beta-alanine ligase [Rhodothalassium salexigens]MBK5910523.1 pantoate--beta-alanine ligase [Rhodothalassium salexigens]MBK5919852.1 pantoate--beta-alanine ligase [Rhodothalassium salexigens]